MSNVDKSQGPLSAKDLYSDYLKLDDERHIARRYDRFATEGLRKKIDIRKADKAADKHLKIAKKLASAYYDEAKEQDEALNNAYESGPDKIAEILEPLKDISIASDYLEAVFAQFADTDKLPPYIKIGEDAIIIDGHSMWSYDASPIGMHGIWDTVIQKRRAIFTRQEEGFKVEVFPSKSGNEIIGPVAGDAPQTIKKRLFYKGTRRDFAALATITANDSSDFESQPTYTRTFPADGQTDSNTLDIRIIQDMLMARV